MHNKSIRQNKFNLPSMKQLWKQMGGYDALVEYNECAVRQFIKKWEQAEKEDIGYREFIVKESHEVDINLGNINIDQYRQDIFRWYLIHPYGCIDAFVPQFKEDLKAFGFDIRLDYDNSSEIDKLIQGLKNSGFTVTVEDFKLNLEKYYRKCRNLLAHKLDEKDKQKADTLYEKLDKEKIFAFYPSLKEALQASNFFNFYDYTLCTANLKNITDTLTTNVFDHIDWNKFDIKKQIPTIIKLRKYGNNKERIKEGIQRAVKQVYGVEIPEEYLIKLCDNLAL